MAELTVNVDVRGDDRLRNLGSSLNQGAIHLAKFAVAGTAAFAAVGAVTSGFASDLNESLSKVNVVFGKNAKNIENWADTASSKMGLSKQAALESAGTFGNLFKAMDIGDKPALNMSKNMTQLASDLASFNNIGTDEALEKIRAGLVGEAEPLRTLGVNISAARTEAKAMELGFKKVDGQLSASAKAQANYALILEDTKLAQGDFARTSDGMANQQRILEATFQDSMAQIGQAFIPIIEKLLPVLTEGLKGFADFITSNMPLIEGIITGVFSAIGSAIGFIADEVVPRLGQVFAWVAENVFPLFQGSGGIVTGVFDAIAAAVSFVANDVFPVLLGIFQKVLAWVQTNWPTISSVIGQVFGAIANAVKIAWPIIARVAEVLFPLILTAAGVLFTGLDKTFKLIGGIFEVVGNVVDTVVKGITAAWLVLSAVTTAIWTGITGTVKGVINGVIDVLNGFFGFLNNFQIGVPEINVGPVHVGGGVIDPFNIGLIPHLAEGGIVTSPTLALLGEQGREAVVPLERGKLGGDFHSHITVLGEDPFIRNEEDLIRTNERIRFLAGFA